MMMNQNYPFIKLKFSQEFRYQINCSYILYHIYLFISSMVHSLYVFLYCIFISSSHHLFFCHVLPIIFLHALFYSIYNSNVPKKDGNYI